MRASCCSGKATSTSSHRFLDRPPSYARCPYPFGRQESPAPVPVKCQRSQAIDLIVTHRIALISDRVDDKLFSFDREVSQSYLMCVGLLSEGNGLVRLSRVSVGAQDSISSIRCREVQAQHEAHRASSAGKSPRRASDKPSGLVVWENFDCVG